MGRRGVVAGGAVFAAAALLALVPACTRDAPGSVPGSAPPATPPGPAPGSVPGSPTGPARAAACSPAKPYTRLDGPQTITSGGVERVFVLHVPADYDGARALGLIWNFHGSGSNKEQQAPYSQLPEKAPPRGYAVVTPDAAGKGRVWNFFRQPERADDVAFTEDLLAHLEATLCFDRERIYATGISAGAAFSASLACAAPHRLSAIAMVAATIPANCPPDVRPSVIAFHGTLDPVVPYGGGDVNASAAQGAKAPGAEAGAAFWAVHDGCADTAVQDRPTPNTKRLTYPGCRDGRAVVFYGIEGGGHTWPGSIDLDALGITSLGPSTREINATDLVLDFFDAHRGEAAAR